MGEYLTVSVACTKILAFHQINTFTEDIDRKLLVSGDEGKLVTNLNAFTKHPL